jgi:hypothetical protein
MDLVAQGYSNKTKEGRTWQLHSNTGIVKIATLVVKEVAAPTNRKRGLGRIL